MNLLDALIWVSIICSQVAVFLVIRYEAAHRTPPKPLF